MTDAAVTAVVPRYRTLLDAYLRGELDDETFAQRYSQTYLAEEDELPTELFAPLDEMFYLVDAFDIFEPHGNGTTTRGELRMAAERLRAGLEQLG